MKLDNRLIKASLMKSGHYNKVSFSKARHAHNKWAVYLKPFYRNGRGIRFHISYYDGNFACQDEIMDQSQSARAISVTPKPRPAKTPLGAIHEVIRLVNEGYRIHKL